MKIAAAALLLSAGAAVATAQTDVQTAQAGTPGNVYNLNGVTVVGNQDTVGSGSVASFFVRDTTSAFGAINIFMGQGDFDALGLQLGDVLDIAGGVRDSFNGFSELTFPGSITNVGSGANYAPIAVSATDFADGSGTAEGLESQRVSITAFADAGDVGSAWAGFTNYTFNDGGGNFFTIRTATGDIADLMQANYGNIGAGAINLVGIFGQFDSSDPRDGGYQLLVAPSPSSVALLGLGGLMASRRRRS